MCVSLIGGPVCMILIVENCVLCAWYVFVCVYACIGAFKST